LVIFDFEIDIPVFLSYISFMENKILIIEDSITNNDLLKTVFELQGWHVTQAFDGNQGMFFLQNKPFDLAVIDLQLPHVHGTEIIDLTLAQPVHPEIVVYSSSLQEHPELSCKPVFALCPKPMNIMDLVDICRKALTKSANKN